MLFGWRIVKHVKSNAIVYVTADDQATAAPSASAPAR
jgi:AICAR transformylase/IMP cyclohydrolase PurH